MKKIFASVVALSLIAGAPAKADPLGVAIVGGAILGAIIASGHEHDHYPPPPAQPPLRPSHNGDYIYRPTEPPVYQYPYPEYRPVYKSVDIYVPECRCYRSVFVRVD